MLFIIIICWQNGQHKDKNIFTKYSETGEKIKIDTLHVTTRSRRSSQSPAAPRDVKIQVKAGGRGHGKTGSTGKPAEVKQNGGEHVEQAVKWVMVLF